MKTPVSFLSKQRLVALLALAISSLIPFSAVTAQESALLTANSFDRSSNTVVLEYEQLVSLLGQNNRTRVSIFGDGTVEINEHPSSSNRELSSSTLSIDPLNVEELVSNVLNASITAEALEEVASPAPLLQAISDNTFSTFTLHVDSYQNELGNTVSLDEPLVIVEKNIAARFLTQEQFNTALPLNTQLLRDVEISVQRLLEAL